MDQLLKELESLVQSGNTDQGKVVLNQLKLAMLSSTADHQQSCAALELGVLLSVKDDDLDAFARNMAQLQPLYFSGVMTERRAHVTGLNLMYLLVENRLAEFHSQLEVLSETEASHPLISFPVGLERQLMVGMYDELLSQAVPDPSYQLFMDHLVQTVRDSIADCMEVSYQQLTCKQAAALMKFDSAEELHDYILAEREDWIVEGNCILFHPADTTLTAQDIPSQQWIQQSLTYATEMERIV